MTKTILFGATLAAVIVASVLVIAEVNAFQTAPLGFVAIDGDATSTANSATLTVKAADAIPRFPTDYVNSQAIVGFGWADLGTGEAFITTIHPVIGRDSHQNPDAWHAHTASLTPIGIVPDDGFCLNSVNSTPEAGIQIQGDTMIVKARTSTLPYSTDDVNAIVGFTVVGGPGCGPVGNTPFADLAVQVNIP